MLCKDTEIQQITKLFKDYAWLVKAVSHVEVELSGGGMNEHKRARSIKRLERMRSLVAFVESAAEAIESERERTMYQAMIEGKNGKQIAQALGVSRKYYYKARMPFLDRAAALRWENERLQTKDA